MGKDMTMVYMISSFEYSLTLELAISDLIQYGIPQEQIKTIPFVKADSRENRTILSHVNNNRFSLFDVCLIMGNIFAVLFCSLGFIWRWGPILWGVLGFFIGGTIGALIYLFGNGWRKYRKKKKEQTEILIMIKCPLEAKCRVKEILWNHNVLGVAEID